MSAVRARTCCVESVLARVRLLRSHLGRDGRLAFDLWRGVSNAAKTIGCLQATYQDKSLEGAEEVQVPAGGFLAAQEELKQLRKTIREKDLALRLKDKAIKAMETDINNIQVRWRRVCVSADEFDRDQLSSHSALVDDTACVCSSRFMERSASPYEVLELNVLLRPHGCTAQCVNIMSQYVFVFLPASCSGADY